MMTKKELDFAVFCIENVAEYLKLNGADVYKLLATRENISLRQAMDVFYKSYTYQEMREGISDMHCRSELYLAEEISLENTLAD